MLVFLVILPEVWTMLSLGPAFGSVSVGKGCLPYTPTHLLAPSCLSKHGSIALCSQSWDGY